MVLSYRISCLSKKLISHKKIHVSKNFQIFFTCHTFERSGGGGGGGNAFIAGEPADDSRGSGAEVMAPRGGTTGVHS